LKQNQGNTNNIHHDVRYGNNLASHRDGVKGGKREEIWKSKLEIGQRLKEHTFLTEGMDLRDLDVIIQNINRIDCPIILDPNTASFIDVGIHAKLRQRLQIGTIDKHLRYARFMETHPCPVNFRKPTLENFMRHMDYREQIEKASANALIHEWKAIQMFLKAYGITIWDYRPPSAPKSHIRVLPYPETVRRFFTFKYATSKYETALYQYMFFFGFLMGVRIPTEICLMKTTDVHFEARNRGYVVITERKKHDSQRNVIPEKAILNSKVHKSLKNWLTSWRPRVANEYSGDALFIQANGKPFTVRGLGKKLSQNGKLVWKDFQPYDMRHWCAVARLIRTKVETGNFDCFPVKNWLGHERMSTTEGYIRYAEQYYRVLPVDWISCALKPLEQEKVAEMHRIFDGQKNQQSAVFEAVDTHLSCCSGWARRDLNSRPTGYQPVAPTDLSYGPRVLKRGNTLFL